MHLAGIARRCIFDPVYFCYWQCPPGSFQPNCSDMPGENIIDNVRLAKELA